MQIPIYQIDAFTSKLFSGNPAAVCPLESWLPDATMQSIAAENNLSETAFFVRTPNHYDLRWFTPTIEADLCGHATLASAFVIFNYLDKSAEQLRFSTKKSGFLSVKKHGDQFIMDFPRLDPLPCKPPAELLPALGRKPKEILRVGESEQSANYLCVYDSEEEVRNLQPEMPVLSKLAHAGVIVTARGNTADFVSRYFAPWFGIPEDPVTGSTHCALVPYWSEKLGKKDLHAQQVSRRGGELFCRLEGDRVSIAGNAICYMIGSIQF